MEQFVISPIWHTVTSLGEKISLLDNFVQVGYKWYYFWYMYVEKKKNHDWEWDSGWAAVMT